ncbi:glycosyltransferase family 2 protein [Shimia sp. Alg240-R146]|uniref:glycosyltransferase family 2 protein n=1 Tax=Shimia sp. Alg240-R146 TaxID=2993449 RepID=UPI0022E3DE2B|nr:glycosyltransferase family A protein [Shimia sp. Alg240-R146]
MAQVDPITVIIQCRNRPLYLWACLDSLYRHTHHPARFILTDNASDDPMVREVVRGFERRSMFHKVEWHSENDPTRLLQAVRTYSDGLGDKIVVFDSDVVVFDSDPCWLTRMSTLMDENPKLGLLGSYVDKRDFIPYDDIAPLLHDKTRAEANALTKATSPERDLPAIQPDEPLIDPFNPAGRLVMARKSILHKLVFSRDGQVYRHARKAGVQCAIATTVLHRHLSLLNAYDYSDYSMEARNAHFEKVSEPTPVVEPPDDQD